jgi:predicted RNase H-like nuclease (RuvC/YqgF family)
MADKSDDKELVKKIQELEKSVSDLRLENENLKKKIEADRDIARLRADGKSPAGADPVPERHH